MTSVSCQEAFKCWWKSWFEGPEALLLGSTGLMTFFGMTLPSSGPSRAVFWAVFVPATIWALIKKAPRLTPLKNAAFLWATLIILFAITSITWSGPTTHHQMTKALSHGIQTLIFLTGLTFGLSANTEQRVRFAKAIILSCIVGAITNIIVFYSSNPLSARLDGMFLLQIATIGPTVLMGAALSAITIMEVDHARARVGWTTATLLMLFVFVLLTQSRGPLISLAVFSLLCLSVHLGMKKTLAICSLVVVATVFFIFINTDLRQSWCDHFYGSPMGSRHIIWQESLKGFFNKPILGHGVATIFDQTRTGTTLSDLVREHIPHPHGLPFYVLFSMGLVGAILQIGYFLTILFSAIKLKGDSKKITLAALVCVVLMTSTDMHAIAKSVGYIWWLYWMPMLTLACPPHRSSYLEDARKVSVSSVQNER